MLKNYLIKNCYEGIDMAKKEVFMRRTGNHIDISFRTSEEAEMWRERFGEIIDWCEYIFVKEKHPFRD